MKLSRSGTTTEQYNGQSRQVPFFDEQKVIDKLKHFLPAQAPLKDFVHHNTLHAFQHLKFEEALRNASAIFGFKTYLSLDEYRSLYVSGRIQKEKLLKIITEKKGVDEANLWLDKMLSEKYEPLQTARIGKLRSNWKKYYQIDIDSVVHPVLFRIVCSYLDQGISIWNFPVSANGFWASIQEIEQNSFTSFFKTDYARQLLKSNCDIQSLLHILIGNEAFYQQYIFDQQMAHQGWSGMVSAIEDRPEALLDNRKITLKDFIAYELLLEIDALTYRLGKAWQPLGNKVMGLPEDLFAPVPETEMSEILYIWQQALEWTYYDEVLAGFKMAMPDKYKKKEEKSFQAMFCIDDREASLRDYLEKNDPACETYATPGFFGVAFYYQPEHGKFYTKQCPAPLDPPYLIKEIGVKEKRKKETHFTKYTYTLLGGWLLSLTLGFWSAFQLFFNIFKPSMAPAMASSFKHMYKYSHLTIENNNRNHIENNLQIGFTTAEMTDRVEALLKSIGMVKEFASLVYVVGHGSSSANNPHYAAYDCGACSGRPGSVNARVFSFMANHTEVREQLSRRGINIPQNTQFIGALHDTCCDEISFYDEDVLLPENQEKHQQNVKVFSQSLDDNSKERSRRFESVNTKKSAWQVHDEIKRRAVSLFEPRPELNHATNALCIVGRRDLTRHLFLDRRAFMNSYDYRIDPHGEALFNILKAAAPVCGGINLEYYFSRVDNQKLGAGTKLPHNVMGLIGVANGTDGDLRPGLPSQMIEVHDPIRLLMIVEHYPEVVLKTIQRSEETYEWFSNEWLHLVTIHPDTKEMYLFRQGKFIQYTPAPTVIGIVSDITSLVENNSENIPVHIIA